MRRMCRQVKRSRLAEGEIVANEVALSTGPADPSARIGARTIKYRAETVM
jgi:hypothetical protein